jgi:hypothetical protein
VFIDRVGACGGRDGRLGCQLVSPPKFVPGRTRRWRWGRGGTIVRGDDSLATLLDYTYRDGGRRSARAWHGLEQDRSLRWRRPAGAAWHHHSPAGDPVLGEVLRMAMRSSSREADEEERATRSLRHQRINRLVNGSQARKEQRSLNRPSSLPMSGCRQA